MRDEDEEDEDGGAGNGGPPSTRSVPLKPVNGEYAKVVPFAVRSLSPPSPTKFFISFSLEINKIKY
jgi:hypothetical protein